MDQLWYKAERELLARKAANGETPCGMNGHNGPTTYPEKLRGVH
jgi:hypothetical protein